METTIADFKQFLQSILDEHAPVTRTPGSKSIEAYTGIQQDKLSWFRLFLEDYTDRVDEKIAKILAEYNDTDQHALNNELLALASEYIAKFRKENF